MKVKTKVRGGLLAVAPIDGDGPPPGGRGCG